MNEVRIVPFALSQQDLVVISWRNSFRAFVRLYFVIGVVSHRLFPPLPGVVRSKKG
ncbi:MAG TPA: hypothetical protein VHE55_03220 [Fimbriimonadaceae bacterium]|nr:hypothetical protein [Fimbriimonadaceae bacterium]